MSEHSRKSRRTGLLPAAIYATKRTLSLGATEAEEFMSVLRAMPVRRKARPRRASVTGTSNHNFSRTGSTHRSHHDLHAMTDKGSAA
jgi:hypothetical protein